MRSYLHSTGGEAQEKWVISGADKHYEKIKWGNVKESCSREESMWRPGGGALQAEEHIKALSQEYSWSITGGKQPRGCSNLKRVPPEERRKQQTERSPWRPLKEFDFSPGILSLRTML